MIHIVFVHLEINQIPHIFELLKCYFKVIIYDNKKICTLLTMKILFDYNNREVQNLSYKEELPRFGFQSNSKFLSNYLKYKHFAQCHKLSKKFLMEKLQY